jgi:hypothetical protein
VALTSRRAERALGFIDRDAERPQSASADALAQGVLLSILNCERRRLKALLETTIAIVPELLPRLQPWSTAA